MENKTVSSAEASAKAGKYLKYAIGEIVLVVVGILIALQINNWNENRKRQNEELNLLLEVKSNLEATLILFKNDTLNNLNTIHQFRKIKHYIKEDLPYNTELDTAFGLLKRWWSPYPISNAYITLKTKGLDIISNVSLRNKIVNLYENEYKILSTDYDQAEWLIALSVETPFRSKYIRMNHKNSMSLAIPNNFETLKHNEEFGNILEILLTIREEGLIMYKTTMNAMEDLIEQIDIELNL